MGLPEKLIYEIKRKNVILFVGAGVSNNLGLPLFDNLIRQIGEKLGYDPDEFESYGRYRELAEYYEIENNGINDLVKWMDEEWHRNSISLKDSKVHKLIFDLDFPIIYTTNYDRWLEKTYDSYGREYRKIVKVEDLVSLGNESTQIIKFHGDFSEENSIVLTESSYFERLDFETPLDIKLRSDILGKTILFIGYSLNDVNLRYLIFKLNKLWENSKHLDRRLSPYIFLAKPNPVQQKIFQKRGIEVVVSKQEREEDGLLQFLSELLEKSSEKQN
ncbi:SIR2-like domain-containing protein [Peptoclostridium litorale DSM 5388]|uniref:SIR2 family protein n=1 Tax=Peptoclostridium litorale DSM 5388 TaxID=1121324 RepID=A0A069REI1_PEPLI|nr:SIR2 family protein [Peptoclostridium litorale]KDR95446.1 SIR2 family protein [Peptoclostridium litorale DSM 5388]SIO18570.1 SIR2-like domain-containing protein [Peptoclostridium litorale DSM 5388]